MTDLLSAPHIGVRLAADGSLDDAEAARVFEARSAEHTPFWREQIVWLALHETARASVAYWTAITFC